MSLFVAFVALLALRINAELHSMNGTVYYDLTTNQYSITLNVIDCESGACCGYFNDTLNSTGWGVLEVKTGSNKELNDSIKMYACGYLEGWISSYEIDTFYDTAKENNKALLDVFGRDFESWYNEQNNWLTNQIATNKDNEYWIYMNLLQLQFEGLYSGYNNAATKYGLKTLKTFDFSWINAMYDYGDVAAKLVFDNTTTNEYDYNILKNQYGAHVHSHCSGLVKVTPTFDNLFFSHDTWTDYYTMNRIYKRYIFELDKNYPATKMTFSSYPGALSSIDDYYIMDNGIATMETTNFQLNPLLWKYCNTHQLFTWRRVRVANKMANDGPEWIKYFTMYNSGTYNNQWMILNYKLFKTGEPLKDGLLWIAEQLPGTVASMDVTSVLERGYWASYNVPAIDEIYELSGNAAYAEVNGPQDSYDLAPRARLFRKYINKYNNITEVQNFMRYNDYKNDPTENNDPTWAIMNRRDLIDGVGGVPFGGTDTKLADLEMLQNNEAIVKAGPTCHQQPTFTWNNSKYNTTYHRGLPTSYDFQWVKMVSIL